MPDCLKLCKGGVWQVRFLRGSEVVCGPSFSNRPDAVSMSVCMRRWVAEAGTQFSLIGLQLHVTQELRKMGDLCSVVDPQVFAEKLGLCSPHELYALKGEDSLEARTARHKARKARRSRAKQLFRLSLECMTTDARKDLVEFKLE